MRGLPIFLLFILLSGNICFGGIDLAVSPQTPSQGRTFTAQITSDSIVSADLIFCGKLIRFYGTKGDLSAIAGVNVFTQTGWQPLRITATDESGNTVTEDFKIKIKKSVFPFDKLLFPPGKQGRLVASKIKTDQDELAEVLKTESQRRLWTGKFLMPIKGRVTSAFGAYRLYNGKRLGDHRGTDIGGNPVGAKIKVANSGVVIFSKPMPTIGSVIVIDHGQGVNSIYMHMSKTLVSVGEKVIKGQVIGKIGNTGLSTGPHLHFGMSIHDTRVDPLEWVSKDISIF